MAESAQLEAGAAISPTGKFGETHVAQCHSVLRLAKKDDNDKPLATLQTSFRQPLADLS